MNKPLGLALLAVGVLLLIWGISAADSPASSISRFFTGQPTDRAMWLMAGGLAALIAGGVLAALSRRQLKGS